MASSSRGTSPRPRRVSLATRIASAAVIVCALALLVSTAVGVGAGREFDTDLTSDELAAANSSRTLAVSSYLNNLAATTGALATSPQAAVIIDRLSQALEDLDASATERATADELAEHYLAQYVTPIESFGIPIALTDVLSTDPAAVALQRAYVLSEQPGNRPSAVNDAGDGSSWSDIHRVAHSGYRNAAEQLDLFDLLLVDAAGRVVYSVTKGPELATSLDTGPFSGSLLDTTVSAALRSDDGENVFADVAGYVPAVLEPVGAIARAVFDDGRRVGAVVAMYRASALTTVMTKSSLDEGSGPSSYLVGSDGTLRSDPESFLESATDYLEASASAGRIDDAARSGIEQAGTLVLLQPTASPALLAEFAEDDKPFHSTTSLLGTNVYSVASQIPIEGLDWAIVSEVDVDSANNGLRDFETALLIGAAIFIALVAFAAVAWANTILRPIRLISDRIGVTGNLDDPVEVPSRSPVEFHALADGFEKMSSQLTAQRRRLEHVLASRVAVLRGVLPRVEVDRLLAGEPRAAEQAWHTTNVVVILHWHGSRETQAQRTDVAALVEELDAAAALHGVERIKLIGDTAFFSCGHDRPFLDHAERSLRFALDAFDLTARWDGDDRGHVDIAVAIHSGAVTAGITGDGRMIYDVWGPTVTVTHAIARQAEPGHLLVTNDVRRLAPTLTDNAVMVVGDDAVARWSVDVDGLARQR